MKTGDVEHTNLPAATMYKNLSSSLRKKIIKPKQKANHKGKTPNKIRPQPKNPKTKTWTTAKIKPESLW